MRNFHLILVLGLIMASDGYTISSRCTVQCESASSIKCDRPAELDSSVLSELYTVYDLNVVDTCATPCQCDRDKYVYSNDKFCEIIQSFAIGNNACNDIWSKNLIKWNIYEPVKYAKKEVFDYLLKSESGIIFRIEETTDDPWETWCKVQCAKGMGGSACYCDIIP